MWSLTGGGFVLLVPHVAFILLGLWQEGLIMNRIQIIKRQPRVFSSFAIVLYLLANNTGLTSICDEMTNNSERLPWIQCYLFPFA